MSAKFDIERWPLGTTCANRCRARIVWENDTHIVLKHHAHNEWFSYKNHCCGTYLALFEKAKLITHGPRYNNSLNNQELKRWEGRWKDERVIHEAKKFLSNQKAQDEK